MATSFARNTLRTASRLQATSSSFAARHASPIFRRFLATPADQPRLLLGAEAPNFKAKTTKGDIDFHEWLGGKWAILFSHPADFTPVCTTELGAFSKIKEQFEKRNTQLIGLSANNLDSHGRWIGDINELYSTDLQFPIIADADRNIAFKYGMVDQRDINSSETVFTIRSVFVIDPAKKIRLTMMYPASVGRNSSEVIRVLDSLQTGDQKGVTTPIDWIPGDDVIVPPSVSTGDAKKKFGEVREMKPYLRYTKI